MRLMSPNRSANPRRPTYKDKKREETRAKLLAAARQLFAEHGYDDVPVTEIAQEAGVTHSMINVYFGGKPGLLYEIIRENNAPQYGESSQIAAQDKPPTERISDLLLGWARADAEDPRLLAIMQSYSWVWPDETEAENVADRARFKQMIARLVEQGQAEGEIARDVVPDDAARAIFAVYTWGMRGVVFDGKTPEECHAQIMNQLAALLGKPAGAQ